MGVGGGRLVSLCDGNGNIILLLDTILAFVHMDWLLDLPKWFPGAASWSSEFAYECETLI